MATNYEGTNIQAQINDAVARGDMAAAAQLEQQRNQKIVATGSSQKQTNYYSQYLNGGSSGGAPTANNQLSGAMDRAVGVGADGLGEYTKANGAVTTYRPEFAGKTVQLGEKYVTYNADGYPVKAVNVKHAQSLGNDYVSQNMGFDMNHTINAADAYQALYNIQQGNNGTIVGGSAFNNAYGLHNVQYDKTKTLNDYDRLIQEAAASGNYVLAGFYEDSRNALIADQKLDPNLQSSKYNGGWNYVDGGGGVGDYTGLRDPNQPELNLGGGWWQEQDKGDVGANTQWYNNHTFPTMEEVIAYGKALGYDMDENTPALSPLVKQMIDSGYVSPATIQKATALGVTVPDILQNLGIDPGTVNGTGTAALEQVVGKLQQGSGSKDSAFEAAVQAAADDAARRFAAGTGKASTGDDGLGSSGAGGNITNILNQLLQQMGSGGGQAGSSPGTIAKYDPAHMRQILEQQKTLAEQQAKGQVDNAVNQAVLELERAQADAQGQFQTQRNQISADEMRGMDNAALYASMRGDRGGIGMSQFNAVQAAAAQNRLAVSQQQTKLATDTARQISDLRAQGEFEKADKLLTLTQNYLSQLLQLEQWANEFNLSIDELNESIRQWQMNYNLSLQELNLSAQQWQAEFDAANRQWQSEFNASQQAAQNSNLAASGEALLSAGVMPNASQLAAMGMTSSQASAYMAAAKAAEEVGKPKPGSPDPVPTPEEELRADLETVKSEGGTRAEFRDVIDGAYKLGKISFSQKTSLTNEYCK